MLSTYDPARETAWRETNIAQQQWIEEEARKRIGLKEGQNLGSLTLRGKLCKHCTVAHVGQFLVVLHAQRGSHRLTITTTSPLIEQALRARAA